MTAPMLPILFLDIDDVLCLSQPISGMHVRLALDGHMFDPGEILRHAFDRQACEVLGRLHTSMNGRLRYVISSTWREVMDESELARVFTANGLQCVTDSLHEVWHTPVGLRRQSRDADIWQWLDLIHQGESFAILDDTHSGATLESCLTNSRDPLHGRVVLCKENVGLQPEHLELLLRALRTPLPKSWSTR